LISTTCDIAQIALTRSEDPTGVSPFETRRIPLERRPAATALRQLAPRKLSSTSAGVVVEIRG
jgi:hypothetical protein